MKPEYVRITKRPAHREDWYYSKEFIGSIWEVKEDADGDLSIVHDLGLPCARFINKSDCEPFEFPSLQEDQHIITTKQLQELHKLLGQLPEPYAAIGLANTFPTAFQPARTYKIGDRFQAEESEWLLGATAGGNAFLIDVNHGDVFAAPFQVENVEKITAKEFEAICYYKPEQFTLLPDSTDQKK